MKTSTRFASAALVFACFAATACSDSTTPASAPTAPSSLTAQLSTTQITLNWLLPPGTVDDVKIQRSVGGGAYALLTTLKPAVGSYVDTGLIAGTVYGYQIEACNSGGCSTAAQISVTTPTSINQPPLAVWNPALPPSLVSFPYEPLLRTTGGSGAGSPVWAIVVGALPPGVKLDASGSFSGTATQTGTFPITVKVTMGVETAQKDLSIRIFQPDQTRWNITRMDVKPVDPTIEPAVEAGIARWESIVTKDLHTDTIPRGFYQAEDCEGYGRAAEGAYVDDMFLMINIGTLPANVIAQATTCGYRADDQTSVIGILTLSQSYLLKLAGTETLNNVVFHEIGHTLGYGVLWDDRRYEDDGRFDYVAAGTCVYDANGNLTVGTDPTYTGPNALREWQAAGKTGNVPLEDQGGSGTACSHWRKTAFKTEVMTGYIEPVGTAQQVSRITLASMTDLGFTVDMSKADPYTPPAAIPGLQAPSPWTIGGDSWLPDHWEIVQSEPVRPLRRVIGARR